MNKTFRLLSVALTSVTVMLVPGCGGNGGGTSADSDLATLGLEARLVRAGTLLSCTSSIQASVRVQRTTGSSTSTVQMSCPSQRLLAGDYAPSLWDAHFESLAPGNPTARAQTWLPAPIVMREGSNFFVVPSEPIENEALSSQMSIEGLVGDTPQALTTQLHFRVTPTSGIEPARWRYKLTQGNITYVSPAVQTREPTLGDFGVWGAVALAEDRGPGVPRLYGSTAFPANIANQFRSNRDFRDVRFVDLDNDGREDIVSSVYGAGCTLIAMARADGNFDIKTPRRHDGGCIGGHSETMLVADFDGDGLVDIFLPSYERFDLLKNLGGGEFQEVADSLGISFPSYLPAVEGAAAVDIDMNGTVDIAVASEVLLNDGRGHFTPMQQPFGPSRLFDEGMAVADIDADGIFDIVKNDPDRGPRIYWGTSNGSFSDAGWMFGGEIVARIGYGVAIGRLTGNSLPDLLMGGGIMPPTPPGDYAPTPGEGPRLCVQRRRRSFDCFRHFLQAFGPAPSDLLTVTDYDNDGYEDLIHRQGLLRIARFGAVMPQSTFRFDLRDANDRRTMYGRSVRARCALDDSVIATKFVDGGNGYMAQGNYLVHFASNWCDRIKLETGGPSGVIALGTFEPGTYQIRLPAIP